MKRALGIALGIVLAVLCLGLFFRGVDQAELWRHVREANLGLIGVVVAACATHVVLRAWRWKTLLGPAADGVPFGELVSAVAIGYMAGILPGRVSEVLRPALLSRRTSVPLGAALATVGAERVVLDMPMIVLFGALFLVVPASVTGMHATSNPAVLQLVQRSGAAMLVLSLVGLGVVVAIGRRHEAAGAAIARWAAARKGKLAAKVAAFAATLLPGLAAFATPGGLVRLFFETFLIWGVIAVQNWAGVVASGVSIRPLAVLMIVPATALGIAVPTPGGAGTYHFVMKAVLVELFAADAAAAVGAALICHAVPLLTMIALGGWFILRGGMSGARAELSPVPEQGTP